MKLFFAWYDFWIGVYWDRKERILYTCLIPCLVLQIDFWNDNTEEEAVKSTFN